MAKAAKVLHKKKSDSKPLKSVTVKSAASVRGGRKAGEKPLEYLKIR